jgi:hypothetical protein
MTPKLLADWISKAQTTPFTGVSPHGLHPGAVKLPIDHIPRAEYRDLIKGHPIASKTHAASVQRVKLKDLKGIQRTVNQERLHAYLENPNLTPNNKRAIGSGMLIDKPVVVKVGGAMFIHDGHHRITAAHVRGESEIDARVVEL